MSWLFSGKRRLGQQALELARLLEQDDVAAATALYEAELAAHAAELDRPLLAAYHARRWWSDRHDKDLQAVRQLADGEPENSPVRRTWQVLQQCHRAQALARALEQGDPDLFRSTVPGGIGGDAVPLERVGLAALEVCRLEASAGGADERPAAAQKVLWLLPTNHPAHQAAPAAAAHLVVWALGVLDRRDRLLGQEALIGALPAALRGTARLAAAFDRAHHALSREQPREAVQAVDSVARHVPAEAYRAAVLAVGLRTLSGKGPRAALAWFEHQRQHLAESAPEAWRQTLMLALVVANFKAGRYPQGRAVLGELNKQLTAGGSPAAGSAAEGLLGACYHLAVLSRLVGTREWAGPTEGGMDRDWAVKNRALWGPLRDQLVPLIDRLGRFSTDLAWRAPLLRGLLAYVEPGRPFDEEQVRQFAVAVERVELQGGETARTRLKQIEGSLAARAKATDEAVGLLRARDVARLRELKTAVLDPLGDALPPLVRAAVYVALWQDDSRYDPLPDLRRIVAQPPDDASVRRCIDLVQAAGDIHQICDECTARAPSNRSLPPLAPLATFGAPTARAAALAAALAHLRRGDLAAARAALPEPGEAASPAAVLAVRFRLAWGEADVETCRTLAAGPDRPLPAQHPSADAALLVRALLAALEEGRAGDAWSLLQQRAGDLESSRLPGVIVNLVVWLIERGKPQLAHALLQLLRGQGADPRAAKPGLKHLGWVCSGLAALVAARLGQYSACGEAVGQFLALSAPPRSVFGDADAARRLQGWLGLFKLLAELAQTARTADDLKARWPATRRALEFQTKGLRRQPMLAPYADLVAGLLAFLEADSPVDDTTLAQLGGARQRLTLGSGAAFVEQAIGRLQWRRRILGEFWQALRGGDLKQGRTIYQQELLPAFGARMPHAIGLGAILLDWDAGEPVEALLGRLDLLEQQAPELSRELIERVRRYVNDGEQIRRLIRLLREKHYDELMEAARRAKWADLPDGAMPVPVAITLMYACFKTRQVDEALHMGSAIGQQSNLAGWVRDCGSLLLGYVLFDQGKYPEAAEAFEKTSTSEVLGHDADRYWAAAQFSQGLQLLAVDQKEKAFDAFARSLGKRGAAATNVNLAPLFVHFGLQSIEARNGNRARHAFQLMGQGLQGASSPEAVFHLLLADLGQLLCQALMDEDVAEVGGDRFLALLPRLGGTGDAFPAETRRVMERSVRILAICQELRRERRLEPRRRKKHAQMHDFLRDQAARLRELHGEADPHDPVLLTLEGTADLLLRGRGKAESLGVLEQALRLGVQSQRLAALLDSHRKQIEAARKEKGTALDLFDTYLLAGAVPAGLRSQLVRGDDLGTLYRLNRTYAPDDVLADEAPSPTQTLIDRLKHLLKFVGSDGFRDDPALRALVREAEGLMPRMTELENNLLSVEQQILAVLARRLRAASLDQDHT